MPVIMFHLLWASTSVAMKTLLWSSKNADLRSRLSMINHLNQRSSISTTATSTSGRLDQPSPSPYAIFSPIKFFCKEEIETRARLKQDVWWNDGAFYLNCPGFPPLPSPAPDTSFSKLGRIALKNAFLMSSLPLIGIRSANIFMRLLVFGHRRINCFH